MTENFQINCILKYYLFTVKNSKRLVLMNRCNKNYKKIILESIIKKIGISLDEIIFFVKNKSVVYMYPKIESTKQYYVCIYDIIKKNLYFMYYIMESE